MSILFSLYSLRILILSGLLAATSCTTFAASPAAKIQPQPDNSTTNSAENKAQLVENYGKLPLSFEANQGQSDPQVKFLSRGQGYSLFLTGSAAVLSLSKGQSLKSNCHPQRSEGPVSPARPTPHNLRAACPAQPTRADTLRMELAHANPDVLVQGADPLPGAANYFLGNDPARWRTNVATYARVQYRNVYDGIDLVYYGNQRQLEYDFIVQPGTNPKSIQLNFAGATKLKLTPDGDLVVSTTGNRISLRRPVVFQVRNGERQPVKGSFSLLDQRSVRFTVGPYDRARALVIDPILVYSTYLGGSGASGDSGSSIAVDSGGNVFVTGSTSSLDFPVTAGVLQSKPNDIFITKLNAAGTALLYSTYFGGSGRDYATSLAIDGAGDAYITGATTSTNFPVTVGAFQSVSPDPAGRGTAFVTSIDPTGTALLYSTYLGGSGIAFSDNEALYWSDIAWRIAVDSNRNAYVTGETYSTDFPVTKGAFQSSNKAALAGVGENCFVSKLDATGRKLVYSTFLGGSGTPDDTGNQGDTGDACNGISLDASGSAYVAGSTFSTDFPTTAGSFQKNYPGLAFTNPSGLSGVSEAGFVTKLNPTGSALAYSTYLAGSGAADLRDVYVTGDFVSAIAVDSSGNAFLTGSATSPNFPATEGAFWFGGPCGIFCISGFFTKLNSTGSGLVYSGFIGDSGTAVAVDSSGNTYVAGTTFSDSLPTTVGSIQPAYPCDITLTKCSGVGFIYKLNASGSAPLFVTYIGGSNGSAVTGIAVDGKENAYLTGWTSSKDFTVSPGAFQSKLLSSSGNAFITRLALTSTSQTFVTRTSVSASPFAAPEGNPVTFTAVVYPTFVSQGEVTFYIDGSAVSTVDANSPGGITYTTQSLTVGKHSVYAAFHGTQAFTNSTSPSITENILEAQTATPTFSPGPGKYEPPVSVKLADSATGAVIYYTTNGNTPTTSSTKYTSAGIKVSKTETIKAIAVANGYFQSAIASATYTITPPANTPTFSPAAGTYHSTQTVKIADTTPGAVISYATVPGTPFRFFTRYTGPIKVSRTETIQAIAIAPNYAQSATASATYTILPPAAGPVFSPSAGAYTKKQTVKITDATPGATIYYGLNGASITSFTKYTGPITVSSSESIQAVATAPGYSQSPETAAHYTIQ